MAMIMTDIGVFSPIAFSGPILLNLLNRRNSGTIRAANGTIMESRTMLNILSLALVLYTTKAYPAADDTIIASTVVTTAMISEFL